MLFCHSTREPANQLSSLGRIIARSSLLSWQERHAHTGLTPPELFGASMHACLRLPSVMLRTTAFPPDQRRTEAGIVAQHAAAAADAAGPLRAAC